MTPRARIIFSRVSSFAHVSFRTVIILCLINLSLSLVLRIIRHRVIIILSSLNIIWFHCCCPSSFPPPSTRLTSCTRDDNYDTMSYIKLTLALVTVICATGSVRARGKSPYTILVTSLLLLVVVVARYSVVAKRSIVCRGRRSIARLTRNVLWSFAQCDFFVRRANDVLAYYVMRSATVRQILRTGDFPSVFPRRVHYALCRRDVCVCVSDRVLRGFVRPPAHVTPHNYNRRARIIIVR